jgi:hypothetical protein
VEVGLAVPNVGGGLRQKSTEPDGPADNYVVAHCFLHSRVVGFALFI